MVRRLTNSRILRLTASCLAVLGLLGHGLAMLLVGLLAAPVAAQSDGLYFGEICTPDGLQRQADRQPGESGGGGDHHDGLIESCPICTAFAQNAAADLAAAQILTLPACCGAKQRPDHESATWVTSRLAGQPRAPPARA